MTLPLWSGVMRMGTFQLGERAGAGGMGEVWAARHIQTLQTAAVKCITNRSSSIFFLRFQDEVRAVAGLQHPNIIRVLDSGQSDQGPWLAMEWADGGALDRVGDWAALKAVLRDVLAALAHAHTRGVIHRDIKPANILRIGTRWVVADFGIASLRSVGRAPTDGDPRKTRSQGTPRYMAPEQIRGDALDQGPPTDLYALGGVAWELACGTAAVPGTTTGQVITSHLSGMRSPFMPFFPVPERLQAWLRWLLAVDPAQRPRHAADALAALESLGAPVPVATVTPAPRPIPQTVALPDDSATLDFTFSDAPTASLAASLPVVDWPRPVLPARWPARTDRPPLPGTGQGIYAVRPVPFVGREDERSALWAALTAVHTRGTPQAVVIRGPSGRGKTRLARWLLQAAAEPGVARTLTLHHDPDGGRGTGLGPPLAHALQIAGLSEQAARRRLLAALPDPFDVPLLIAEALQHGGQVSRAQRHAAVLRWLKTAESPWLLHIDDAQWAGEALDLAEAVLASDCPALVVLTVREEALTNADRLDALTDHHIRLPPLTDADHHALVRQLLGLSGPLTDRIAARTAGNPLFAVALVGDWVSRGILVPAEGGLQLAAGSRTPLPASLKAVWQDRLGALLSSGEAWWGEALQVAALLGMQVDRSEWQDAVPQDTAPLREALLAAHLTEPTRGGVTFGHGMFRETVLMGISDDDRPRLHAVCAAAIVNDESARQCDRIAAHWRAAGQPEQALALLRLAFYRYQQQGNFPTALARLEAHDAIARPGSTDTDLSRIARAQLHLIQGEPDRATAIAESLLPRLGDPPKSAELAVRVWLLLSRGSAHSEAQTRGRMYLERILGLDTPPALDRFKAMAWQNMGTMEILRSDLPAARSALLKAKAIPIKQAFFHVDLMRNFGYLAFYEDNYADAVEAFTDALQHAQQEQVRLGVVLSGIDLCRALAHCGRADEALPRLPLIRRAVSLYSGLWPALVDLAEAELRLSLDQPEAAAALLAQCRPVIAPTGRMEVWSAHALHACVAARQGDHDAVAGSLAYLSDNPQDIGTMYRLASWLEEAATTLGDHPLAAQAAALAAQYRA